MNAVAWTAGRTLERRGRVVPRPGVARPRHPHPCIRRAGGARRRRDRVRRIGPAGGILRAGRFPPFHRRAAGIDRRDRHAAAAGDGRDRRRGHHRRPARLRHRAPSRAARILPATGAMAAARVRRPDGGVLRPLRWADDRAGPVRSDCPYVRPGDGGRGPDALSHVRRLQRGRWPVVGHRRHRARLLAGPVRIHPRKHRTDRRWHRPGVGAADRHRTAQEPAPRPLRQRSAASRSSSNASARHTFAN